MKNILTSKLVTFLFITIINKDNKSQNIFFEYFDTIFRPTNFFLFMIQYKFIVCVEGKWKAPSWQWTMA